MQALVVTNRAAGLQRRHCAQDAILETLVSLGYAVHRVECKRERTVEEVRRALDRRPQVVVAAGGDGTLNLTANALAQTGIPLCIVPCGTANDLAGTLGIPQETEAALWLLREGELRAIDLGWVNGRYFINVASLGMSAKVAHAVQNEQKKRWGKWAYLWEALRQARRRPVEPVELCVENACERLEAYQISVANGERFGGGWRVAHRSAPDDETLDVVVIAKGPHRWKPRRREPPALEQVADRIYHTKNVEILAERRLLINLDGEPLRLRPPLRFQVCPKALQVFVPRNGH